MLLMFLLLVGDTGHIRIDFPTALDGVRSRHRQSAATVPEQQKKKQNGNRILMVFSCSAQHEAGGRTATLLERDIPFLFVLQAVMKGPILIIAAVKSLLGQVSLPRPGS